MHLSQTNDTTNIICRYKIGKNITIKGGVVYRKSSAVIVTSIANKSTNAATFARFVSNGSSVTNVIQLSFMEKCAAFKHADDTTTVRRTIHIVFDVHIFNGWIVVHIPHKTTSI